MRRNGFTGIAAAACAGLLAAACAPRSVGVDVPTPGPVASAPKGVEGEWITSDRVAVSRFAGGIFTTTATDTGNRLADGNYTLTSPTLVAITVVSKIRNTTSNVNCSLVSTNQLNCTSSTGQQFVLMRRTPGAA